MWLRSVLALGFVLSILTVAPTAEAASIGALPVTNSVPCPTNPYPEFAEVDGNGPNGEGPRFCFANAGYTSTEIHHVKGIWSGNNRIIVFYFQIDSLGKPVRLMSRWDEPSTYVGLDDSFADNEVVRLYICKLPKCSG
jgi:hypothetical protein